MRLLLQLVVLCIFFYLFLRYDLGITHSKSVSRAILCSLVIGVICLFTLSPTREGAESAYPGLVMGNPSNYFGTSKSDDMSESEYESSSEEESTDDGLASDKTSGIKKKKKKKKKK